MQSLTVERSAAPELAPIDVRFMWDRGEHRRLISAITRNRIKTGLGRIEWWWTLVLVSLSVLFPVMMGQPLGVVLEGAWFLAVFVGFLTLLHFSGPWLAARKYPRQHACVSAPFGVTLSDEGTRVTCDHTDVHLRWEGIRRAVETREFLLFYSSNSCAHYIPKRALAPGQLENARETIQRHVPLLQARS